MTDDSAFKKQVRARMEQTGEKYTVARRMVAGHDPGQPPLALRVFLNPHVDLELTDDAARAYDTADEPSRRDMANRLLADHIELAGVADAGVAAGSEILTIQELRIEEISRKARTAQAPGARAEERALSVQQPDRSCNVLLAHGRSVPASPPRT